ncbi:MAG: acetolactate synthase, partial [Planctomycetota bacterium]
MDFENQSSYPSGEPGQEWPCLRQFCVFMENRVGYLHQLLKLLEKFDLRIIALSTVDSVDVAMTRIVLDNYERAREIFELSNYTIFEKDLIGVELPD